MSMTGISSTNLKHKCRILKTGDDLKEVNEGNKTIKTSMLFGRNRVDICHQT